MRVSASPEAAALAQARESGENRQRRTLHRRPRSTQLMKSIIHVMFYDIADTRAPIGINEERNVRHNEEDVFAQGLSTFLKGFYLSLSI